MKKNNALIFDNNEERFNESVDLWMKYDVCAIRALSHYEILAKLTHFDFHIVVLLEGLSSRKEILTILRAIRDFSAIPVIVGIEEDYDNDFILTALRAGADDIWFPPHGIPVAVARGVAIINRYLCTHIHTLQKNKVIFTQFVTIDLQERKAFVNGQQVDLRRKEFDILNLLITSPNQIFTYNQIYHKVWGEDFVETSKSVLWNQMDRLRSKLQISDELPSFIKTSRGVGYGFNGDLTVSK